MRLVLGKWLSLPSLKCGDARLDIANTFVEIACRRAYNNQHRGVVSALLPNEQFHALVLRLIFPFERAQFRTKRANPLLNLHQDIQRYIGRTLCHKKNIA
jgi:hypothetical protein